MNHPLIVALIIILFVAITGCKSENGATKRLQEARECTSRGEFFRARELLSEAEKRAPAGSEIAHVIQKDLEATDRVLSELGEAILNTPQRADPQTNE